MARRDYLSGWDVSRVGSMSIGLNASVGAHGVDTITLSTGTFSHVSLTGVMGTGNYQALAAYLQTTFNALGGGRPTMTVTYTASTMRYSFSVSSGTLAMSFTGAAGTRMQQALGYSGATGATSSPIVSTYRPYYAIRSSMNEVSNYSDEYESGDGVAEAEADDGTPYSIARTTLPKYADWDQMMETKTAPATHLSGGAPLPGAGVFTYSPCPTTEVPWTWEHMVQHVRGYEPFALYDDTAGTGLVCKMRKETAGFKPARSMAEYDVLFNVPFKTRLLGRL